MAIREIIYLNDPRLRKKSLDVTEFSDNLQELIDDMFETMYHAKGVGLAAPQIGINKRLTVIDVIGDKSQQLVLINPKIISEEGSEQYQEGCLSVPGAYATVTRAQKIVATALDRHGKPFEIAADGLLGECIQHEIDHLNGKLFIDLLSPLKRTMQRKKFEKYIRSQEKA